MKKYTLYFVLVGLLVLIVFVPLLSCSLRNQETAEQPVVGLPRQAILENAAQFPTGVNLPEEGEFWVALITANTVNVRASATSQSASLGRVNSGDMLRVLNNQPTITDNGIWYAVQYNNSQAFIHGDFVAIESVEAGSRMQVAIVTNIESYLNIRAQANTESNRVGQARAGERLRVLERDAGDGWTMVQFRTTGSEPLTGYVRSDFLSFQELSVEEMLLQ